MPSISRWYITWLLIHTGMDASLVSTSHDILPDPIDSLPVHDARPTLTGLYGGQPRDR